MSQPALTRHIPCTLSATMRPASGSTVAVDFILAIPSLGFEMKSMAVMPMELISSVALPEEALFAIGRKGMTETLSVMKGRFLRADWTAPQSDAPQSFDSSDLEILRAFGIKG